MARTLARIARGTAAAVAVLAWTGHAPAPVGVTGPRAPQPLPAERVFSFFALGDTGCPGAGGFAPVLDGAGCPESEGTVFLPLRYLSAGGVTAFHKDGELHAPAASVEVIDTVGAGDTFNAGFLAGLNDAGVLEKAQVRAGLSEHVLRDALALGVKAAGVTVSRAGANPPRRSEL